MIIWRLPGGAATKLDRTRKKHARKTWESLQWLPFQYNLLSVAILICTRPCPHHRLLLNIFFDLSQVQDPRTVQLNCSKRQSLNDLKHALYKMLCLQPSALRLGPGGDSTRASRTLVCSKRHLNVALLAHRVNIHHTLALPAIPAISYAHQNCVPFGHTEQP